MLNIAGEPLLYFNLGASRGPRHALVISGRFGMVRAR